LPPSSEPRRLKAILGAFGRSGTSSLRLALANLGMYPLHGSDALIDTAMTDAFVHGDTKALARMAEERGYDVTLELHR
jgi:hypothetical protein